MAAEDEAGNLGPTSKAVSVAIRLSDLTTPTEVCFKIGRHSTAKTVIAAMLHTQVRDVKEEKTILNCTEVGDDGTRGSPGS